MVLVQLQCAQKYMTPTCYTTEEKKTSRKLVKQGFHFPLTPIHLRQKAISDLRIGIHLTRV